jgi:hypothetical protein
MCWAEKAKWVAEVFLIVGSMKLEVLVWFGIWSGDKGKLAGVVEYNGIGFWLGLPDIH